LSEIVIDFELESLSQLATWIATPHRSDRITIANFAPRFSARFLISYNVLVAQLFSGMVTLQPFQLLMK
jgi:hypothetical protein